MWSFRRYCAGLTGEVSLIYTLEGTRKLESILVDERGSDKEVRKVLEGGRVSGVTDIIV